MYRKVYIYTFDKLYSEKHIYCLSKLIRTGKNFPGEEFVELGKKVS